MYKGKYLAAVLAFESFHVAMDDHVNFQVVGVQELFAAHLARPQLLPRVESLVQLQIVQLGESFTTLVADLILDSGRVVLHVVLQPVYELL